MNIDVNSERSRALDIALSSRDRLQNALSSAKHGNLSAFGKGMPLTIRHLLHSNVSRVRTVAVDLDSSRYMILYKWYSLCTLCLRDVYSTMYISSNNVVVSLDENKMALYVISAEEVLDGLSTNMGNKCEVCMSSSTELVMDNAPSDVLTRCIRKTALDCTEHDWEVYGESGTIITVFSGNKFSNVMSYCDNTLSSNPEITSAYIGRVCANLLYDKYVSGDHVEIYLSNIMCSKETGCEVYCNAFNDDIIKRLSIRDQINTIVTSTLNHSDHEIVSTESKLMTGMSLV